MSFEESEFLIWAVTVPRYKPSHHSGALISNAEKLVN